MSFSMSPLYNIAYNYCSLTDRNDNDPRGKDPEFTDKIEELMNKIGEQGQSQIDIGTEIW